MVISLPHLDERLLFRLSPNARNAGRTAPPGLSASPSVRSLLPLCCSAPASCCMQARQEPAASQHVQSLFGIDLRRRHVPPTRQHRVDDPRHRRSRAAPPTENLPSALPRRDATQREMAQVSSEARAGRTQRSRHGRPVRHPRTARRAARARWGDRLPAARLRRSELLLASWCNRVLTPQYHMLPHGTLQYPTVPPQCPPKHQATRQVMSSRRPRKDGKNKLYYPIELWQSGTVPSGSSSTPLGVLGVLEPLEHPRVLAARCCAQTVPPGL